MKSLNLLVLRCANIERSKSFYELFGLAFNKEQHGNGPLHYSSSDERGVFEIYPLEGASADLVTSTMLLHELPAESVDATLAETRRLLAPGGVSIHLDFRTEDPFWQFVMYGHGQRNNEPFLEPLIRMDLAAAYRRAGFDEVRIEPFAEREGATDPSNPFWRFPWAAIIARKPA